VQALTSYVRGTLTLHSTLMGGFGVFAPDASAGGGSGSAGADAATAALGVLATFMAKEMSGHLSSLLFSLVAATQFDAELRWWHLFADLANDAGLTLEMVAPLLGPRWFLPCTVAGNVCRSLCGVAAGSTRAAISAHFGARGNVADVQSREGAQETAVTMCGLALGYLFGTSLNATMPMQLTVFAVLTLVHIVANVVAVRALHLRTVNAGRAAVLTTRFLFGAAGAASPSPADIATVDSILPLPWRVWESGPRVHMGARLSSLPHDLRDAMIVRVLAGGGGGGESGAIGGAPTPAGLRAKQVTPQKAASDAVHMPLRFDVVGRGGMALVSGCGLQGTVAVLVATPTTAWVLLTTVADHLMPRASGAATGVGLLWQLHVAAHLAVRRSAMEGAGATTAAQQSRWARAHPHQGAAPAAVSGVQEWEALVERAVPWLAAGGWDVASARMLDAGWRVAQVGDSVAGAAPSAAAAERDRAGDGVAGDDGEEDDEDGEVSEDGDSGEDSSERDGDSATQPTELDGASTDDDDDDHGSDSDHAPAVRSAPSRRAGLHVVRKAPVIGLPPSAIIPRASRPGPTKSGLVETPPAVAMLPSQGAGAAVSAAPLRNRRQRSGSGLAGRRRG